MWCQIDSDSTWFIYEYLKQNFSTRCLSAWQRAPITPSNSCRQWAVSGGMSLDRSASFCLFLSVQRSHRRIPQFKFFVKYENTNIQVYFRNTFPCPMIRKPKTTVTSLELFIFYMMQLSTQTHTHTHPRTHTHCTKNLQSWVHAVRDVWYACSPLTLAPPHTRHCLPQKHLCSIGQKVGGIIRWPLALVKWVKLYQKVIWMLQCAPILSSV